MEKDRVKWNRRYKEGRGTEKPADVIRQFYPLAPKGKALDIAAGNGRNALFLADRGFDVDAVDVSDVAVKALSGIHPSVNAICADLDTYNITPAHYSLIVNIRFLNRRLFPYIKEGLKPGGLLIFESYVEDDRTISPLSCRDFLLRENELLHAFLSLKIIYYEEKDAESRYGTTRTAALAGVKVA
ncbi:tellurium resistance protein TehB [Desulfonema ishimotonii]|uniref:Tellurium resistance protein TehB n=1 Tax=Desulfonema ishimotonii TaxID=45657 RepID=A0A401FU60_9BACT|nr:methyltransferase domain-containing protein [Desulfonema ishimotonii]GBC60506.1 tellurium resistance protein TehB [Desulfonema ishimotonii]